MEKLGWKLFRSLLIISIMATSLFALTACGDGDDETTTTAQQTSSAEPTTAAEPTEKPVLKFGALLDLTTVEAVECQKWLKLFAKLYNDAGGWEVGGVKYEVKPMVYDCGTRNVAKLRTATERAVLNDGVKYIVANWYDIPAEVISITEPNKVLYCCNDFTDATLAKDLKYTVRTLAVFLSRYLSYRIEKDMMAKGAKTVVIVDPDTEQGKAGDMLFKLSNEMAGMKVLGTVNYPMETVDFGPIVTKIVSYNPDYVELGFVTGNAITNIIGGLKDAGYTGLIMPSTGLNATVLENVVKRVGAEYLEGSETTLFDPRGIAKDPRINSLIEAYIKEYGEWRAEGCWNMGSWFFFEDAVNNTQSLDVDVLVKYLYNSKHSVMTLEGYSHLCARPDIGNYRTVDAAGGHYLGIIKDGKYAPLGIISAKDQYIASIKVYGLTDVFKKYWAEYGYPDFAGESDLDYDFLDQ